MNTAKHIPISPEKIAWWIIGGLLVLQFLPYLLLWDDAYVRIHDTLEAEWMWYDLLVNTGQAFNYADDAVVPNVMNGLSRKAFHTGLSFNVVWISIFGTYWGYVFNYLLIHLIGFGGMFLLLRRHFLTNSNQLYIVLGVSVCFAWVPYFTALGITVAGQPLLFFALLNILKNKEKWWDYLVVALFPFYTSIVWAAPPVIGLAGLILIGHYYKERKINFKYVASLLVMSVLYLVANYQLLALTINPGDFVSHREAYNYFYDKDLSIVSSLLEAIQLFFISHYHVGIFVGLPIVLMAVISFYHKGNPFLIKATLWMIVAVCLFYGFYNWLVYYLGDTVKLLATFKFERVSVLLPFLWCFLMAVSLEKINQNRKFVPRIIILMAVQFIIIVFSNDEFLHNSRHLAGIVKKPSYKAYIAEDLFREIKEFIGRPQSEYRVVSLGMNPGIALFNGFYTLDGLQAIYDLRYKKKFRSVIAGELRKNEEISNYFDGWGNRCYVFSDELGKEDNAYLIGKDQEITVKNLSINTNALRELGGEYIISALPVENYKELDLKLAHRFVNPEAYWNIYLYKVN